MILKQPIGRGRMFDIIHKGGVNLCFGASLILATALGVNFYEKYQVMQHRINPSKDAVNTSTLEDVIDTVTLENVASDLTSENMNNF